MVRVLKAPMAVSEQWKGWGLVLPRCHMLTPFSELSLFGNTGTF